MRARSLGIVLVLTAASGAAFAQDCPAYPPPTNFAAGYAVTPDTSGFLVNLTWTPAPTSAVGGFSNAQWMFLRYDVQRRDDTAQGQFVSLSEGNLNVQNFGFNGVKNRTSTMYFNMVEREGVFPCIGSQWGPCVVPGRTYTYRVLTKFRYRETCALYENGKEYDGEPTPEITVPIPGPPPPPDPKATDVRAVTDTKKGRVTLTWKNPDVPFEKVEILRAPLSEDPQAKAFDAEFEVVRTLQGAQMLNTTFVDRIARKEISEKTYSYALVHHIVDGVASRSDPDAAYPPGICPAQNFKLWQGALDFAERAGDVTFQISSRKWIATTECDRINVPDCPQADPGIETEGLPDLVRPFRVGAKLVRPTAEYAALRAGTKGTFSAQILQDDPFDPFSWVIGIAEIQFAGKVVTEGFELVPDANRETTVCGTIAAPKLKVREEKPGEKVEYRAARPGENIAFVFQCVALGPSPLLAGRVLLSVEIYGGRIVDVAADGARPSAGSTGSESLMYLDLGALGPVTSTRSERATVVVQAVADSVPANGQLRCRVGFIHVGGGVQPAETIRFSQAARSAEVLVDE